MGAILFPSKRIRCIVHARIHLEKSTFSKHCIRPMPVVQFLSSATKKDTRHWHVWLHIMLPLHNASVYLFLGTVSVEENHNPPLCHFFIVCSPSSDVSAEVTDIPCNLFSQTCTDKPVHFTNQIHVRCMTPPLPLRYLKSVLGLWQLSDPNTLGFQTQKEDEELKVLKQQNE